MPSCHICMGPALAYPMENEMPLIHHAVEWWGCNYTNEDGKGLSGRTQGHLMLKTKSKLMQWSGSKGRYWAKMITNV
jgi:hypothetical protein